MSFEPKPVEDAQELPHPGNPEVDPHAVILDLVRSLNSKEAEGIIVQSIKNLSKITGLKSQLDSLAFLRPTLIALEPEVETYFADLNNELLALVEADSKILERFQQLVAENKKNDGSPTDIPNV